MIKSFACEETAKIAGGKTSPQFPPDIQKTARRKLAFLDAAASLQDIGFLPGNRLEVLKGDRRGRHSIRVNDKYRICFRWAEGHAEDVEMVDYH